MKLKEIERTANQAWSPASHHPIFLATGTSAQQLDASFSTNAALEIFELDFGDPSLDMKLRGSLPTHNRFHKLIWGGFGMGSDGSSGVIVSGGDNGAVTLYSATKVLAGGKETIIGQNEKHSGPVRALDFNPFQNNLLATGANDSEIYIWDLNNFSVPMTPGANSQTPEDIRVVAWNRQVQHILASAHPSGKAVVWDLRKNEPIIKVSDHSNRMRCSGMEWHPEVATQLVLASEDDRMPVIQMWDLRFATSPLKVLENHTKGILSICWSQADPELLLSSAKDNKILCWNPNTGEVIYELPTSNQWCFDVQWCPRSPVVLSAAAFDGRISIYSVMGGNLVAQQLSQADKISSSFNNLDPFGTGQPLPPLQVPQHVAQTTVVQPLKKPPKWIRQPVGACFAFGGKLITFDNPKAAPQQAQQLFPRQVFISQVTTETQFLQRSNELQAVLQSSDFINYCQSKIRTAQSEFERSVWNFLKVNFEQDARSKFLNLLGYSKEEVKKKISSCLGHSLKNKDQETDTSDLEEKLQDLPDSTAGGDASTSSADFFDHIPENRPKFEIPIAADTDGLIGQALLIGSFEEAVELCLSDGRFADAIILAVAGGEGLLRKTQQKYFINQKSKITSLLSSIVTHSWREIVQSCDLGNWKEALAALLTYAKAEEFSTLCDTLGSRLEVEGDGTQRVQACLCYICSGNVEKLVQCWVKNHESSLPLALEDLVEKVMMLQKSMEVQQGTEVPIKGSVLAEKLTQYASLLAAQGSLAVAMSYLPANTNESSVLQLRDRLFHSQGEAVLGLQPPPFPFAQVQVDKGPHVAPSAPVTGQPTEVQRPTPKPFQQAPHQPGFTPLVPAQPSVQPSLPPVFSPPASAAAPPPSPSFVPLSSAAPSGAAGTAANVYSRVGMLPSYPKHPTSSPGTAFLQPQPFSYQGIPLSGTTAYPSPPSLPASTLSGPSFSTVPSSGPVVPGSPLRSPSYQATNPLPPPSQPGFHPPVPQGLPSTPTSTPVLQHLYSYPAGAGYTQGPLGMPSLSFTSTTAPPPPPPTGYFPWLENRSDEPGPRDGWNDPPNVHGMLRRKKLPENYTAPAPITAPVMSFPAEPQPLHSQVPSAKEVVFAPPGAPKEASMQPQSQLPAEKIERKAIPSEHLFLKTTFDKMVQCCYLAAGDPQTKRKLDDATKRLENLYDKLREHTLSPNILGGLHEIAHCIECRNYQQALSIHTQVVSSSNFSEISAFMPVLKVVMTVANKLNV
ncbi:protein transport protein Sec31A isoform X4 [Latimeria chalumnae]|uniref:protein transport protein Sec31A isoform X4 n=1 Tax=Latimeria chalumnae TaxID=7897 RepID=UPI00313C296A